MATPSKNGLELIAWDLTHFREGVANFKLIIPLMLKGLVPIMKHLCWIFQNTQTFSISDGFYGRPLKQGSHFFWDTLYDDGTLSHYHTNLYLASLYKFFEIRTVFTHKLSCINIILYWGKGKNTTICGTNSNVFNILLFTLLDLSA